METKDLFPDEFFKQFKTGDKLYNFTKNKKAKRQYANQLLRSVCHPDEGRVASVVCEVCSL